MKPAGDKRRNPQSLPPMAEKFRMQAVEAGLLCGKGVKEIASELGMSISAAYRVAHKLCDQQHAQLFSGKSRGAVALLARTRATIEIVEGKLKEATEFTWPGLIDRLMAAQLREAHCIAALAGEEVAIPEGQVLERYKQTLREMGAESLGLGVN